jgi:predicted ATPase
MSDLPSDRLKGRALEIWNLLVRADGDLVTKDEIMNHLWPGVFVGENSLHVHVAALRKALDKNKNIVKTVSGRGYRLLPNWQSVMDNTRLPGLAVAAQPVRLPASLSRLFGRRESIDRVGELLGEQRLVTLIGMGGIGKTQLGLEVARLAAKTTRVAYVEFATAHDEAQIRQRLADALGIAFAGGTPTPALIAAALGPDPILVVFDNCEHLTTGVAKLAEFLLRNLPEMRILATSREPLWVGGEVLYQVPPLPILPSRANDDAVALFIARVQAVAPSFTFGETDLAAAAAICGRLHGIPLAIELAAPRAAAVGTEALRDRLDDRFALLTGGNRAALPQHQALRATMDWSYDLLSEQEKVALYRLAVFEGEFDLEAGYEVIGSDLSTGEFANILTALVMKSLVVSDHGAHPPLYSLLETTRAYAREKADAAGNTSTISNRHAEYVIGALGRIRAAKDRGLESNWFDKAKRDVQNLYTALNWAFSPIGDAKLAVRLSAAGAPILLELSMVEECKRRVETALALVREGTPVSAEDEMTLNASLGTALTFTVGPTARSNVAWDRLHELAETHGANQFQARALWGLWTASIYGGKPRQALALARRFEALGSADTHAADPLMAIRMIGVSQHFSGDQISAKRSLASVIEQYDHSAARSNTAGYRVNQSLVARAVLSRVGWISGNVPEALRLAEAAVEEARRSDHVMTRCYVFVEAGIPILLGCGQLESALKCLEILQQEARRHGLMVWEAWGSCYSSELEIAGGDLLSGVANLRMALSNLEKTGFTAHHVRFVGLLGETLLKLGDVEGTLISKTISVATQHGNDWYLPELMRINALKFSLEQNHSEADAELSKAISLAKQQGAWLWVMRSTIALATSLKDRGEKYKAAGLLKACHIPKEVNTPDVVRARTLLAELA